jgi:diguanylate cyclase (GGDEF)-like protein
MSKKPPNAPTTSLLKKLGAMTALREMPLLEQSLLRMLGPVLGARSTTLYRVDRHREVVRALHHAHAVDAQHGELQRTIERIEEIHTGIVLPDHVRELFDGMRMLGRHCSRQHRDGYIVGYPLYNGDTLRGYFLFEREHDVTPHEDALVDGVLEVFCNYYALLDTSKRDRLTGLLNRYALELNLGRLWDRMSGSWHGAADARTPDRRVAELQTYWLGVLDIDHFKRINDGHGHIIGDEILLLVARLLEKAFRRHDLLYRYGGEEFVVVIAADDSHAAAQVFERVRRCVEEFNFPQVGRVTVSGGYCVANPSVLPQTVINQADRALYEAKSAGRNRIFHYDDLIDRGVLEEVASGSIDLF